MSWLKKYTNSSIGKKQVMALTGLAWAGFAISHLLGNLPLAFGAKEAFNAYAQKLADLGPLLYVAELGLVVMLLTHMVFAIKTNSENKKARPIGYAVNARKGPKGIASFTMFYSGLAIFAFIVFHIITFKYGPFYCEGVADLVNSCSCEEGVARDLYRTVVEQFAQPWYSAIYILAMIAFGLHVSHGIGSAFQTLGLNHPRYNKLISLISNGFALLIAGANIAIVVIVMVKGA